MKETGNATMLRGWAYNAGTSRGAAAIQDDVVVPTNVHSPSTLSTSSSLPSLRSVVTKPDPPAEHASTGVKYYDGSHHVDYKLHEHEPSHAYLFTLRSAVPKKFPQTPTVMPSSSATATASTVKAFSPSPFLSSTRFRPSSSLDQKPAVSSTRFLPPPPSSSSPASPPPPLHGHDNSSHSSNKSIMTPSTICSEDSTSAPHNTTSQHPPPPPLVVQKKRKKRAGSGLVSRMVGRLEQQQQRVAFGRNNPLQEEEEEEEIASTPFVQQRQQERRSSFSESETDYDAEMQILQETLQEKRNYLQQLDQSSSSSSTLLLLDMIQTRNQSIASSSNDDDDDNDEEEEEDDEEMQKVQEQLKQQRDKLIQQLRDESSSSHTNQTTNATVNTTFTTLSSYSCILQSLEHTSKENYDDDDDDMSRAVAAVTTTSTSTRSTVAPHHQASVAGAFEANQPHHHHHLDDSAAAAAAPSVALSSSSSVASFCDDANDGHDDDDRMANDNSGEIRATTRVSAGNIDEKQKSNQSQNNNGPRPQPKADVETVGGGDDGDSAVDQRRTKAAATTTSTETDDNNDDHVDDDDNDNNYMTTPKPLALGQALLARISQTHGDNNGLVSQETSSNDEEDCDDDDDDDDDSQWRAAVIMGHALGVYRIPISQTTGSQLDDEIMSSASSDLEFDPIQQILIEERHQEQLLLYKVFEGGGDDDNYSNNSSDNYKNSGDNRSNNNNIAGSSNRGETNHRTVGNDGGDCNGHDLYKNNNDGDDDDDDDDSAYFTFLEEHANAVDGRTKNSTAASGVATHDNDNDDDKTNGLRRKTVSFSAQHVHRQFSLSSSYESIGSSRGDDNGSLISNNTMEYEMDLTENSEDMPHQITRSMSLPISDNDDDSSRLSRVGSILYGMPNDKDDPEKGQTTSQDATTKSLQREAGTDERDKSQNLARMQQARQRKRQQQRRRICGTILILLFIFGVMVTALLFLFTNHLDFWAKDSESTAPQQIAATSSTWPPAPVVSAPMPVGNRDEQERFNRLYNLVNAQSSDSGAAAMQQGTAQSRAFEWVVQSDNFYSFTNEQLIQRYALATFFYSTGGPGWYSNGGWLSDSDECTWFTQSEEPVCSNQVFEVLDLGTHNNVTGQLPPEISILSALRAFRISNGNLTGSLPVDIGYLTLMETFDVASNQLSGEIPMELSLWQNATSINMADNLFESGPLPAVFGEMQSLINLYLGGNAFTGSFPSSWNALGQLQVLNLEDNLLTGSLPDISSLVELRELNLNQNLFTSFPQGIGSLQQLEHLLIGDNGLVGGLPVDIMGLKYMTVLQLHNNQLNGTIPVLMSRLYRLVELDLSSNRFSGEIPVELGAFFSLQTLDLSDNRLTGGIPDSFVFLPELVAFRVNGNELDQDVSQSVCDSFLNLMDFYADCHSSTLSNSTNSPNNIFGDDGGLIEGIACDCCTHCCDPSGACFPVV